MKRFGNINITPFIRLCNLLRNAPCYDTCSTQRRCSSSPHHLHYRMSLRLGHSLAKCPTSEQMWHLSLVSLSLLSRLSLVSLSGLAVGYRSSRGSPWPCVRTRGSCSTPHRGSCGCPCRGHPCARSPLFLPHSPYTLHLGQSLAKCPVPPHV